MFISISLQWHNYPSKPLDPLKGSERLETTPTIPPLSMVTECKIAEKLKDAMEVKNIDIVYPCFADGMIYKFFPSTLVVMIVGDVLECQML